MILKIQPPKTLKKTPSTFLVALLMACCLMSCKDVPNKHSEVVESKAEVELSEGEILVNKAIEAAGGMENWLDKKTMSYVKNIESYDDDGKLIRKVAQTHKYQLKPSFKAYMTWEQDGSVHEIVNSGNRAWKLVDGKIQSDKPSVNIAWNSSFGSQYMASMPFKLKAPGTQISYQGIDTLSTDRIVHKLKVTYEKGAGSSGGMHTWYYFLNTNNYMFEANYLDHGKGYSYTDYDTFLEVEGIVVTKERKSYLSNENMELTNLKTIYRNSDIQFDVELPEQLFKVND